MTARGAGYTLAAGLSTLEEPLSFDPIAMIERSYEPHVDAASWLQATTDDVVRAIDPGCLAAMSYVLGSQGPEAPMAVSATGTGQLSLEQTRSIVTRGFSEGTLEEVQRVAAACRKPGINSLRQILGHTPYEDWLSRWRERPVAFVDAIAVLLPGPAGKPILLSIACAQHRAIHESEQALWHRVAIHLSAGWRLAGRPASTEADDVEAIVTAEGQVAHASGAGTTTQAHEQLRRATKSIDRARSRQGRSDPAAALDLWQGLLAGRWSLVEHFDSDGRRFMLARRNDPGFADPAALTRRQRQVLFYASVGLSNKEMAYALGLAENTISAHLAAGLTRLHITSRAELIRTSSELALEALSALAPS